MKRYGGIVVDPPWPQPTVGKFKLPRHKRPDEIAYDVMPMSELLWLPVDTLANDNAHIWIWTTNAHLRSAFELMEAWGAKYLTTLTWVKPSGFGAYWANTTQHCLFGYYGKLRMKTRYLPTNYEWVPRHHSRKPDHSYRLVERVSESPYVEVFARERRLGWDSLGNEIDGIDIRKRLARLPTE